MRCKNNIAKEEELKQLNETFKMQLKKFQDTFMFNVENLYKWREEEKERIEEIFPEDEFLAPITIDGEQYLNVSSTAKYLDVSTMYVYQLKFHGILTPKFRGKRLFFNLKELKDYKNKELTSVPTVLAREYCFANNSKF